MMILVHVILAVGIGLIILMILAVLYIVVNTIQLTVFARRKEIEIMKLVGATDWFIRWPFILEGIMLARAEHHRCTAPFQDLPFSLR